MSINETIIQAVTRVKKMLSWVVFGIKTLLSRKIE